MTITSTTSGVTDGSTSNDSTISLTFTSSEITTDFVAADISVSGGSLSDFTGSNKVYTATFTPSQNGDCTINVNANKFKDTAGNGNSAATEFNWKYDNTTPSIFTVGNIVTLEGTIVSNYWNSTNTGLNVTVPVSNDSTLVNGTIQLKAKKASGNYVNLGSAYTIVLNDIDNDKTLSVTAAQFEAIDGGISDGDVITISANITDAADNNRLGNPSTTTLTVDQTSPGSFQVGSVVTTGGTVVANYWNSTNTGIDITVPVANESTLTGGKIQLRGKINSEQYANRFSIYNYCK